MKYYYAGPDNKTAGPVTLDEIEVLIKSGTLKNDPMVVPEGSSDWKPLSVHTGKTPAGGPPPPPPPHQPFPASVAAERAKVASQDALGAFKTLAGNPVGGLAGSYDGLGPARAFGVGITFCVLCIVFTVTFAYRSGIHPAGFGGFLKVVLFSVVPVLSMVAATALGRIAFRGKGDFKQDLYVAGASSLPFAITLVIGTIVTDPTVLSICGAFAICLTVLMLNAGMTRIAGLTERAASVAVPAIIVVAVIVAKFAYQEMIKEMVRSSFGGGGFPGFQ